MKTRVNNPNRAQYYDYGGRGITICDEWEASFEVFRDWAVSNGYSDELTLDRIDNDKGYCPSNCRWATRKQQTDNRRSDNSRKVLCIESGKIYKSAKIAAKDVGCGRTNIVEALSGRTHTACGFHWRYV